ncbi:MAG: hypothetical protein IKX30_06720, partial [Victivallales bacterium]|nr:hypothetical protein [Victivallales bacterium]
MKNPKTFVFLAFVLLFHLAFVSCKSIQKEPVVSECKLCSPEAKAKRQAWIASLSKKHLLASDDDDDDDKEHSLDIEQYHRHLRNTIRRMTKLEALCQCNPFEGDQLDAFSEIPFRKTLLFKNLQVLDQLTNKN